jgi:cobyrinic acid a,c-diamide synthase
MLPTRKSLGYVEVNFLKDCLLGATGHAVRGHEYHYSEIEPVEGGQDWENIYQVSDSRGMARETLGISAGNVLASYAHVYFGHRADVAERIVRWVNGGDQ